MMQPRHFERVYPVIPQTPHSWWNHVPGCFLAATNLAAEQLTHEFRNATRNARLLVMEVNPSASEGWLPERSWNWIVKRETEDAR